MFETNSSESENMSDDDNMSDISNYSYSDESSDDESGSDTSDLLDYNYEDLQPTSAPKLEEIAYVTIAITLWNRATVQIPGIVTNHQQWFLKSKSEVFAWSDQLFLPKLLSKSIKDLLDQIFLFVSNWVKYHFRAIFFLEGNSDELYRFVDRLIWNSNGTISYKKTARNLLDSDVLTNDLKYRFACTYCLTQDIRRLWHLFDNNDPFAVDKFHKYPLIYYWHYCCNNEMDRVQSFCHGMNINMFMMRLLKVDNWAAKEYFFSRMRIDEQIICTIWLIDQGKVNFQKLLLIKLSEFQRLYVYLDRGVKIIMNYMDAFYEKDALSTWYEVRDLLTSEQFTRLCMKLLKFRHASSVFAKIWSSSCKEFRHHVLTYKNQCFIRELMAFYEFKPKWREEPSIDFLSTVLLCDTFSVIKREIAQKAFFFKYCKSCMLNDKLETLNLLISVCFPEAEECARFRLSLVKIARKQSFDYHCQKLIMNGKIEKLVRLLNFCFLETYPESKQIVENILKKNLNLLDSRCLNYYSSGNVKELKEFLAPLVASFPEIILDYKTKLILSEKGFKMCINYFGSSLNTLAAIIADGFPSNSKTAAEFKRNIIFSDECIDKLQNLIVRNRLNNAKKFVGWFLKTTRDKKKLKARLIVHRTQQRRRINSQMRKIYSELL